MKTFLLSRAFPMCAFALNIARFSPAVAAPALAVAPVTKSVASEGTSLPDKDMPKEVRAFMLKGAETTKLALFPIGANGTPILLHAWSIKRGPADADAPTLFCVDLFDRPDKRNWRLASSTAYVHEEGQYPPSYTTRWLHPNTKHGVVIAEETFGSTGSTIRLITLPEGVPTEGPRDVDFLSVQKFFTSSSGGFYTIGFGVDASGTMTVEKTETATGPYPNTLDTFAWRDDHWSKVTSKRFMPK